MKERTVIAHTPAKQLAPEVKQARLAELRAIARMDLNKPSQPPVNRK